MNAKPMTIYSSHTSNWPMLAFTVALGVPLVVMGLSSNGSATAGLIPLVLVVLLLVADALTVTSLRVTIGENGVATHFGVFGWPRYRVAADRIACAEGVVISPRSAAFGVFWTPRDGLRLTLRPGPALRLTLISGRRVTINVQDADAAIAALDAAR